MGEINFSNIFCVTQDIKILSFQHVISIKVINEIFVQSLKYSVYYIYITLQLRPVNFKC